MKINEEKQMTIVDDQGNEQLVEILFTYENEERKTNYVFFQDPSDADNVIVMKYTEDGELQDILDDDEYAEVEEVFNAYNEDPKIQELKNS